MLSSVGIYSVVVQRELEIFALTPGAAEVLSQLKPI